MSLQGVDVARWRGWQAVLAIEALYATPEQDADVPRGTPAPPARSMFTVTEKRV